jgi:hypothetical protein
LDNQVYLGIFVYDDSVDVSTMSPEKMRELAKTNPNVFSFPELQIVSDEQYLAARAIIQANQVKNQSAVQLPRYRNGSDSDRPMLFNGSCFAPVATISWSLPVPMVLLTAARPANTCRLNSSIFIHRCRAGLAPN